MEGDLVLPPGHKQRELISIHSLRMEGDLYPYGYSDASDISIHSLRMEGDTAYPDQTNQGYNFNPLPPHGGRLSYVSDIPSCVTISIHSLRMEGDQIRLLDRPLIDAISIHSLRMEGDPPELYRMLRRRYFNPLPPHGGRPLVGTCCLGVGCNFNPLPPHGGRHNMEVMQNGNYLYFNPLPPHGGRR